MLADILDVGLNVVRRILGTTNDAMVRSYWPLVKRITHREPAMQALDDAALRRLGTELRQRVANGTPMAEVQEEAFALVREVADRQLGIWNAIRLPEAGFPDPDWQEQLPVVQDARAKLAAGAEAWSLDLPAALYAKVRARFPDSVPPFRMRAHDVQLMGAAVLNDGRIAEQKTGEGKTLAAIFAAYLNALAGNKVHVVTVNEYLAARDARDNLPVFAFLGMGCGVILAAQSPPEKQQTYALEVVYGQNSEFGFDYLRDNLKTDPRELVQTRRDFAIVDEVDSVLIDEARVPLIISGPTHFQAEHYQKADEVARQLEPVTDYEVDIKDRHVTLTECGMDKAAKLLGVKNLYGSEAMHLPHFLDNALKAHALFEKDKQYLVVQGKVAIVDEFTGRTLTGRRWSDGLHQAIEAKERVPIEPETQTYATITYQNFFRLYKKLAGMTGTAMTEADEFNTIYKLRPVAIPTNRLMIRADHPDLIFGTEGEKFEAIVNEVEALHAVGQPILVGTITVDVSERLSEAFTRRGIPHNVLNARQHQREAEIVLEAGRLGAVTIATNMAGRGTDIRLGKATFEQLLDHWRQHELTPRRIQAEANDLDQAVVDCWATRWMGEEAAAKIRGQSPTQMLEAVNRYRRQQGWPWLPLPSSLREGVMVRSLGGLRIVGTERHDSRRIDNQLRGRSGRQGDPGSSRFYLSLDDPLMKRFAGPGMAALMKRMGLRDGIPIESKMVSRAVEKAQKRVEEYHFGQRKNLLEYDQVMNTQRTHIYAMRSRILANEGIEAMVEEQLRQALDDLVQAAAKDGTRGEELARRMAATFNEETGVPPPPIDQIPVTVNGDACRDFLLVEVQKHLAERRERFGEQVHHEILRYLTLERIDHRWKDHLYQMDHLRMSIGLESYGQKDPRLRYKEEGYKAFVAMGELIRRDLLRVLLRVQIRNEASPESETSRAEAALQMGGFVPKPAGAAPGLQPDPDGPCPCGSGMPFRHCHG